MLKNQSKTYMNNISSFLAEAFFIFLEKAYNNPMGLYNGKKSPLLSGQCALTSICLPGWLYCVQQPPPTDKEMSGNVSDHLTLCPSVASSQVSITDPVETVPYIETRKRVIPSLLLTCLAAFILAEGQSKIQVIGTKNHPPCQKTLIAKWLKTRVQITVL